MTDIEALRSRVDEFDEWLRERYQKRVDGPSKGGNADVANVLGDLVTALVAAEARMKVLEQAIDHFSRRLRFACFDGHRAVEKIADEMVALINARQ